MILCRCLRLPLSKSSSTKMVSLNSQQNERIQTFLQHLFSGYRFRRRSIFLVNRDILSRRQFNSFMCLFFGAENLDNLLHCIEKKRRKKCIIALCTVVNIKQKKIIRNEPRRGLVFVYIGLN